MGAGAIAYLLYSNMNASNDDTRKFHTDYLAATESDQIRSLKTKSDNASNDAKSSKNQLSILMYLLERSTLILLMLMNGPNEEIASRNNKKIDLVYDPDLTNHN